MGESEGFIWHCPLHHTSHIHPGCRPSAAHMHLSARWLVASTIHTISHLACLDGIVGHEHGIALSQDVVPDAVDDSIPTEDRFKLLMFGAICSVKMHPGKGAVTRDDQ